METSELVMNAWEEGRGVVPITEPGRSVEWYLILSCLTPHDLEGKTVLNVGAGFSNLERDLEKYGVRADVTELDIRFDDPDVFQKSTARAKVAADALHLTEAVGSGSFDLVFSGWAVGAMAYDEQVEALIQIYNVLKNGGEAYVYPGTTYPAEMVVMERIERAGGRVKLESIRPTSVDRRLERMAPEYMQEDIRMILEPGNYTLKMRKIK